MRNLGSTLFVKVQDWRLQQQLHRDEEGLTILAYALGAAFVVIPLAAAMILFGQSASDKASADLAALVVP